MRPEIKWLLWILAVYSCMLLATAYAEETETVQGENQIMTTNDR